MSSLLDQAILNVSIYLDFFYIFFLTLPSIFKSFYYVFFPLPRKSIKNDIVLVTGSGQGLGREMALSFAKLGCEVVCVDLNPDFNIETVRLIRAQGGKARGYVCNVADREAVMKLGKEVGRVDILVNNAGVYPFKSLWNSSEEEMRAIIDINMFSHFWTLQAFLPGMKERNHGHVVCISSIGGLLGIGYVVPYTASKYAVAGIMAAISQELIAEKKDVHLTTVYPYFIKTRPELETCVEKRLPGLDAKEVAESIVLAVQQNLASIVLPNKLLHTVNLIRCLPSSFERKFHEYFPLKLTPPLEDEFKEMLENKTLAHTGNMTKQTVQ